MILGMRGENGELEGMVKFPFKIPREEVGSKGGSK
jgi:hypothetical protein